MTWWQRTKEKFISLAVVCVYTLILLSAPAIRADDGTEDDAGRTAGKITVSSDTSIDNLSPDLFTGSMTYRVPIDVPAGRAGLTPALALSYRSSNGNGWLGVGWDLEMDMLSIERNTKKGVNYSGNDFMVRKAGVTAELVNIPGTSQYHAKIESDFLRFIKIGDYWEATDKTGKKFRFGYDSASRLNDPASTLGFRWCLDRVTDTNGNYISYSYASDRMDGGIQLYLNQIAYAHSSGKSTPYVVKFLLEGRDDLLPLYTSNFAIVTGKRLKTIEIWGYNTLIRKYELAYDSHSADGSVYSPLTHRSLLGSVTEYGRDGTTAKPPLTFTYSNGYTIDGGAASGGWKTASWTGSTPGLPVRSKCFTGDVYGNGENALGCFYGTSRGLLDIERLLPNWQAETLAWTAGVGPALPQYLWQHCITGDFKGEGKTGIACNIVGPTWEMAFPLTPYSWTAEQWPHYGPTYTMEQCFAGDFDGNGKTDFACYEYGVWHMKLSTGSDFGSAEVIWAGPNVTLPSQKCLTGDFNGDGKTDFACFSGSGTDWEVWLSDGTAWHSAGTWHGAPVDFPVTNHCQTGDVNGDGKTDMVCYWGSVWYTSLSTGTAWSTTSFASDAPVLTGTLREKCVTGDYNGDGKTDVACYSSGGVWEVGISTGHTWHTHSWSNGPSPSTSVGQQCLAADFDGDGKTDISCYTGTSSSGSWETGFPQTPLVDLLTSITNGIGGETSIEYTPSNRYDNVQLPFTVQTVSKIIIDDGIGCYPSWHTCYLPTTMTFTYGGGYFYPEEREFRGFNYAKKSGPGEYGQRTLTETWFHQGNDTAVMPEDSTKATLKTLAAVPTGYMKGRPYRVRITDDRGRKYSETEMVYGPPDPSVPYYFNPTLSVDSYICDGNTTDTCKGSPVARRTYVSYGYDGYGNLIREDRYGDPVNAGNINVNMTLKRTFSANEPDWIVGLPSSESVFQGIGDTNSAPNLLVRHTNYYYDDITDCTGTPTGNQTPTKGNLTRMNRWISYDTTPESWSETRTAYSQYGNPACIRDPNGNITTITYDPTFAMFPTSVTNAKNQATTSAYYGVDGAVGHGSFGQIKSTTDPNGGTVSAEYDVFGRKTLDVQPDGFWTKMSYNSFGTVGKQNIRTDNQLGYWSESFFDGLGRTIKERRKGVNPEYPANTAPIVTETEYDSRGNVQWKSLPHFEYDPSPWQEFSYDIMNRSTGVSYPDGTNTLACHNDLVSVLIDRNGHRRLHKRDALGRVTRVDETLGTFSSCTAAEVPAYNSTYYSYDVLGNFLCYYYDGICSPEMMNHYDTLGRIRYDVSLGRSYDYYADGSLKTLINGRNQATTFSYDSLNRVTAKNYVKTDGTPSTITYRYDEPASWYPIGRLTSMIDEAGTVTWDYDIAGREIRKTRNIDIAEFTISKSYDGIGRLTGITYPDNSTVGYTYDGGGNLADVQGYASFSGYNALGQPKKISYANGTVTYYRYDPFNFRLLEQRTTALDGTSSARTLNTIDYQYDNQGNITGLRSDSSSQHGNLAYGTTSFANNWITQVKTDGTTTKRWLWYDGCGNRTYDGRYHVDSLGYLIADGEQRITYTYDNMPATITTVDGRVIDFAYDGNGIRIKKIASGHTRLYIDKYYECVDQTCSKYIYAGSSRIANRPQTNVYFYHADHLGSTWGVTDMAGNQLETIAYYPFGKTKDDKPSTYNGVNMIHKYTGQELDSETATSTTETGLYNYGARLYDPELGRFLSRDTIVPDYLNPQALNRYVYALNNPLRYNDPTGHSWDDVVSSVGNFFSSIGNGISSFFSEFSDLRYDSGNSHASPSYSSGNSSYQTTIAYSSGASNDSTLADNSVEGETGGAESAQVCSVPSSQGFDPSGDQIVSLLGFGATNVGTLLSVAGSASPSAAAGSLVADLTFNSASNVFGFAPNQKVSDIGGFTSSAAGTGVGMVSAGELLSSRAAVAVGVRTVPTLGLAVSVFGTGVAAGTLVNHFPVYGTNQNVQQWWSDYIWNTFGNGRGIR